MHVIKRRGWEIPEHQATPESVFLNRRALIGAGAGLLGTGLAGSMIAPAAHAQRITDVPDPTKDLYPAKKNEKYVLGEGRALTPEETNANYNNFYEFGGTKNVTKAAQALAIRPWTVKIDGMVEKPFDIAIDDLIRKMPLEERLYRMRCVEAWSMTIPWTGFQMSKLLELAKPLSSAKYVVMQTFQDNKAPGFKQTWYPWPYTEGLTIAEASNELTFLVTGMYGKPALKQMGAPLRLAVPWKYGFKSVKSIVRFEFTDKRPKTFWEQLQPAEYGFWANVNPEVSHPRWSQADEEDITTKKRIPTVKFNGYGEFVAGLYTGPEMEKERLWA
jgi:sulfoxide reductase catalytic subunit YedY